MHLHSAMPYFSQIFVYRNEKCIRMLKSFKIAEQVGVQYITGTDSSLIKVPSLVYVYPNVLAVVTNELLQ